MSRNSSTRGMRPFSVLLFLSPLLGTRAFSLDSRGSGLRRLDVRSTTDVCASVMDSELRVDISTISVPVISLRSPSFSYLVGKIEDSGSTFGPLCSCPVFLNPAIDSRVSMSRGRSQLRSEQPTRKRGRQHCRTGTGHHRCDESGA